METFDKKIVENSGYAVIYLNELCRLCLNKKKTMVPIYDRQDDDVPLPVKLMACVNLEVYKGDGLPSKLCLPCKNKLDRSYHFKKKCNDVHNQLKKQENLLTESPEDRDKYEEFESKTASEKSRPLKRQFSELKISNEEAEVVSIKKESFDGKKEKLDDDFNSSIDLMPDDEILDRKSSDLRERIEEYGVAEENIWVANASADENIYMPEGYEDEAEGFSGVQPAGSHDVSEYGELKVFKCDKCPKAFTRHVMLKSHQSVHSTQRGFTCQACEKWFPTRSALIRHERTHTGEKPFGCNICHRAFAQKEILLRHLMTHPGQEPFQYLDCDESFTQRETLRVQMRPHQKLDLNDIQLHHCQLCPKAFRYASGLSRHLATHTGRTYKCLQCGKSFTDKSSLLRHCRIHG